MGVRITSLKIKRWQVKGTLVLLGSLFAWVGADRFTSLMFTRFRPRLETELSRPLGHPLILGEYKGLRPWGFSIGATSLNPTDGDKSSIKFSALTLKFAPISSLLNWQPVAILNPHETRVDLHVNDKGSYWLPGKTGDKAPPNISFSPSFP